MKRSISKSRTDVFRVPVTLLAITLFCAFLVNYSVDAGISFKIPIPLLSFYNPLNQLTLNKHLPHKNNQEHPQQNQQHHYLPSLRSRLPFKKPKRPHRRPLPQQQPNLLLQALPLENHSHQDIDGKAYLHDADSVVKFYYKENMLGQSNRVDIHKNECREVPMDYYYQRPKSLWAKHCITLYQSGQCKGDGIQVAGMVAELRSAGMYYGVNSFKPCEQNIRIRFMPSSDNKHQIN